MKRGKGEVEGRGGDREREITRFTRFFVGGKEKMT